MIRAKLKYNKTESEIINLLVKNIKNLDPVKIECIESAEKEFNVYILQSMSILAWWKCKKQIKTLLQNSDINVNYFSIFKLKYYFRIWRFKLKKTIIVDI